MSALGGYQFNPLIRPFYLRLLGHRETEEAGANPPACANC